MERSTGLVVAGFLGCVTLFSPSGNLHAEPHSSHLAKSGLAPLSKLEMEQTEGALIGFVPIAVSLLGGVGFGVSNAIEQYQETGDVSYGEVAAVGIGGTLLTGVNVAAGMSRSITAIIAAGGLDLAVNAAMAFADQDDSSAVLPIPTRPTPLAPEPQLPPPGWTFDPSTLPPPEVIYQPNYYPVNPDFSFYHYPQNVWQMDEVSAGAGEEHYRYF